MTIKESLAETIDNYIFPSDFARSESEDLDNACNMIEALLDERVVAKCTEAILPRKPTDDLLKAGWGFDYRLETTLGRYKAENRYRDLIKCNDKTKED